MLENFLEEGFKIKEMSAIICVAERTICRQVNEYNLSKTSFKNNSGADLDKKSAWDTCRISLVANDYIWYN